MTATCAGASRLLPVVLLWCVIIWVTSALLPLEDVPTLVDASRRVASLESGPERHLELLWDLAYRQVPPDLVTRLGGVMTDFVEEFARLSNVRVGLLSPGRIEHVRPFSTWISSFEVRGGYQEVERFLAELESPRLVLEDSWVLPTYALLRKDSHGRQQVTLGGNVPDWPWRWGVVDILRHLGSSPLNWLHQPIDCSSRLMNRRLDWLAGRCPCDLPPEIQEHAIAAFSRPTVQAVVSALAHRPVVASNVIDSVRGALTLALWDRLWPLVVEGSREIERSKGCRSARLCDEAGREAGRNNGRLTDGRGCRAFLSHYYLEDRVGCVLRNIHRRTILVRVGGLDLGSSPEGGVRGMVTLEVSLQ